MATIERAVAEASIRRPRLLVVDDEIENIELITRVFRDQYEVFSAQDGQQGLAMARRCDPNVIVSDQRMPNLCGVELLAIVEQEIPQAIRVLVTAYADYSSVVQAVNHAHIHHYVEKPLQALNLVTVVNSLVRTQELERERGDLVHRLASTVQDLDRANLLLAESEANLQREVVERTQQLTRANDELRRANELLRQMAVRDDLTSLFNHRYLLEHLVLEIARAKRYNRGLGLVFIDLDEFRVLNERLGHAIGDQVLVQTARLVQGDGASMRRSDFAARFGGDEFCVLLPETQQPGTLIKAERIRRAVESLDWSHVVPGCNESVTASMGIAQYPEHGLAPDELIEAANKGLQAAKIAGRNCICDPMGTVCGPTSAYTSV